MNIEKGFKFIDLFCGIGGFHQVMSSLGGKCVFASDMDKECQKTYYENYGIQPAGDITKVNEADIEPFDVLCAGFPCLTADSLVCTDKGYKKIVDLVEGDSVLSHDGKFHSVEALMYQGVKPTYKIKTSGMLEVNATDNHKFYVRKKIVNGNKRTYTEPEWKTVGEIMSDKDGTYMFCSPINTIEEIPVWNGIKVWENQFNQKTVNELDMSDTTLWYLLGRFVGDGWVRKQWKTGDKRALYSGIVICCTKTETDALKTIIGDKYSYTISHETTTDRFHFTNTELGYFASQFGEGANGKVIPGFVLNLPKEQLKEFIKGYEDSDGCVKDGIHMITSINQKLLYGISHCIEKVYNVPCKIRQTHRASKRLIDGRMCNNRDCYRLEYRNYSSRSKHLVEKNCIWYPISSIIENGVQDVYDIQVEGTHTFVVNHSLTHNCQAFSIAGKRMGFADATRGTLFFDVVRIAKYHKPRYMLLENVKNLASHDNGNTWKVIYETLRSIGYNVLKDPVIFSPHFIGIPQLRERVFIMCIREDVGYVPEFYFDKKDIPVCNPDAYLQDDEEIEDIEKYRIAPKFEQLCNYWDEFVKGVKVQFPCSVMSAKYYLNPAEYENLDSQPEHLHTEIKKNLEFYKNNKKFIDSWLKKGDDIESFKGCGLTMEWHADRKEGLSIWDHFFQIRQSGLRVKRPTTFPTLVASDNRSIIGPRKRCITPRECARIQSFPDSFKINPKDRIAYKQFGNSVNVEVVKIMAKFMFGDEDTRNKYTK